MGIIGKAKRNYYENMDLKFWATVNPLFSNKIAYTKYITLEKNRKIVNNDKEVPRISMNFCE